MLRYIDFECSAHAERYYHEAIRLGWTCSHPFQTTIGWSVCTNRP